MKNIKTFLLLSALLTLSACSPTTAEVNQDVAAKLPLATTNSPTENDVITFKVTGGNFKFFMNGTENPDINVKKGDRVRIEFTNDEGFHDWVVDEFSAATKQIKAGESSDVEFVADKSGTFEYYCSVGEHRAMGMKGKLIVE